MPNPARLPRDLYFGECSGVALNSNGHVFVLSRGNTSGPAYAAAATQLLEFGPDGRFIREIGHNLHAWSFAHTVKVDAHDNIWVTDKGADMVIKFAPDGRVAMVFGRKQEAADEETGPPTCRCRPRRARRSATCRTRRRSPPAPSSPARPGRFASRRCRDPVLYSSDAFPGRIYRLTLEGKLLGVLGQSGKQPKQFGWIHEMACPSKDVLFVAELLNWRA